jgi:hypothetical protein
MRDKELAVMYHERLDAAVPQPHDDCASPEELAALVDRRTPQGMRLTVLRHVAQCRSCQRDLDLLRAASGATRDLGRRPVPSLGVVASVAVLLVGAAVWQFGTLWGWDVLRDARGDVELVTPAGAVSSVPVFVWRVVPGVSDYRLEIADGSGQTLFSSWVMDTAVVLPEIVQFIPNVEYVWWVEARLRDGAQRRSAVAAFHLKTS